MNDTNVPTDYRSVPPEAVLHIADILNGERLPVTLGFTTTSFANYIAPVHTVDVYQATEVTGSELVMWMPKHIDAQGYCDDQDLVMVTAETALLAVTEAGYRIEHRSLAYVASDLLGAMTTGRRIYFTGYRGPSLDRY